MQNLPTELPPRVLLRAHIFRKRLPLRVKLQEILNVLGPTDGKACLDIGMPNVMMSRLLRQQGGTWQTIPPGPETHQDAQILLEEGVHEMAGDRLPFDDKSFDVVVVTDFLERQPSAEALIAECHRILRPDGRLIVTAARTKACPIVRPAQVLLGCSWDQRGLARPGYSESELFEVLKDGFDVHEVRSFLRFFVELTDAFFQAGTQELDVEDKIRFRASAASVFFLIASQLDMLLFFTRGYSLIATAKRRTWRSRRAPVLVDGRSISEAVLSKAVE